MAMRGARFLLLVTRNQPILRPSRRPAWPGTSPPSCTRPASAPTACSKQRTMKVAATPKDMTFPNAEQAPGGPG
jgi:hypothetical protein